MGWKAKNREGDHGHKNKIRGGSGNDILIGGAGDDILNGGTENNARSSFSV